MFPVAWTALYADIAITSATAIDRLRGEGRDIEARNYFVALAANLILNAGWSWLFFKYQKLGASAIGAAVLAASSADLAGGPPRPIRGGCRAAAVSAVVCVCHRNVGPYLDTQPPMRLLTR